MHPRQRVSTDLVWQVFYFKGDLKTAKYLKKQLFTDNAAKLALAGAQLERDPLVDALIEGGLWQLLEGHRTASIARYV